MRFELLSRSGTLPVARATASAIALALSLGATGAAALEMPAWARGGDTVEPEATTTPAAIEQALAAGRASMDEPPAPEPAPVAKTVPSAAARAMPATPPDAPRDAVARAPDPAGGVGFNPFAAPRPDTLVRSDTRAVDTDGALGLPAALACGALACIGWLLRRLWIG